LQLAEAKKIQRVIDALQAIVDCWGVPIPATAVAARMNEIFPEAKAALADLGKPSVQESAWGRIGPAERQFRDSIIHDAFHAAWGYAKEHPHLFTDGYDKHAFVHVQRWIEIWCQYNRDCIKLENEMRENARERENTRDQIELAEQHGTDPIDEEAAVQDECRRAKLPTEPSLGPDSRVDRGAWCRFSPSINLGTVLGSKSVTLTAGAVVPVRLNVFEINDIACDVQNEIARLVQEKMGVTDGGFAGQYFSGDERLIEIAQIVGDYAEAEWKQHSSQAQRASAYLEMQRRDVAGGAGGATAPDQSAVIIEDWDAVAASDMSVLISPTDATADAPGTATVPDPFPSDSGLEMDIADELRTRGAASDLLEALKLAQERIAELEKLRSTIANLKPYQFTGINGWDQAEDAFVTLNRLIEDAGKLKSDWARDRAATAIAAATGVTL
jgi:hypothetical protein